MELPRCKPEARRDTTKSNLLSAMPLTLNKCTIVDLLLGLIGVDNEVVLQSASRRTRQRVVVALRDLVAIGTSIPRWDESQASAVPIFDSPIVHSIVAMKTDKELLIVSMIPQSIGVAWAQRRKSH